MIALIDSLGGQEMFLLVVIGLLLYGRNLPEAGRNLGRVLAQLKRGFHEFKDQLDRDGQIRDVKKTLHDTTQELRRVAQVPRAMADPGRAMRDLANAAISSPPPDTPDPSSPSPSPDADTPDADAPDGDSPNGEPAEVSEPSTAAEETRPKTS